MGKQVPMEPILRTNEFNKPEILTGRDAISQLFVHLIKLEPGTYSSRPAMGVGIVSRYRNIDAEKIEQLQVDIQNQISTYLPEFEGVDVNITVLKSGELEIDIEYDNVLYKYETIKQDDNKVRLVDLK